MIQTTRPYADLQLRSSMFTNPRKRSGLAIEVLHELALHIGRHDLEYPLRVTPSGTVTGGQRRYRAIGLLINWRHEVPAVEGAPVLADSIDRAEEALFDLRAAALRGAVPCVVDDEADPGVLAGKALADNLLREPMHSYDIAEALVALLERGDTMTKIAQTTGRSKSYVSRMLGTWQRACPELHLAWETGQRSYEQVRLLAELPEDQQRLELQAPQVRGSHGRPGVDALKSLCERARKSVGGDHPPDWERMGGQGEAYRLGVRDALRVATGAAPLELIDGVV